MKKLLFFTLIFCSISLWSMDSGSSFLASSPKADVLFRDRSATMIQAINETPAGGFVGVESPFYSDTLLEKALQDARERGVRVERHATTRDAVGRAKSRALKADKSGKKVARKVSKSVLKSPEIVVPGLHAKRLLIADVDPENCDQENNKKRKLVFEGSDNMTLFSRFHKEGMLVTQDDPDYFADHYLYFKKDATPLSPIRRVKPLFVSPKKKMATRSTEYDLTGSIAERINTLFKAPTASDMLDIRSMGLNAESIIEVIEKGYRHCSDDTKPTIRFFLDRTAKSQPKLLERLQKAGGDNVQIYIYNQDADKKIFGRVPELQHFKGINRKIGERVLSTVSTGNLTSQSDREINYLSYHPNNKELFEKMKQDNDQLAQESTRYKL